MTIRQRRLVVCDMAHESPEILRVHLSSIDTSAQRNVELSSAAKNSSVFAGLAFQPRRCPDATRRIDVRRRPPRRSLHARPEAQGAEAAFANCMRKRRNLCKLHSAVPAAAKQKAICACAIGTRGLPRPPFVAWHDSCSSPLQAAVIHRPPARRECDVEED